MIVIGWIESTNHHWQIHELSEASVDTFFLDEEGKQNKLHVLFSLRIRIVYFFLDKKNYLMSDSPIPTPRQNQPEVEPSSPDDQISKSVTIETSMCDSPELPLLFQIDDDRSKSGSTHVDENNENEAVGRW